MYGRYHLLLCILAVLMILTSNPVDVTDRTLNTADLGLEPTPTRALMASYTLHDPIEIASDADFTAQGWPGTGTEDDPYVIEDLNITSTEVGIGISDTRVYFEIRNCIVSPFGWSSSAGVLLSNVTDGTVCDTIIERHYYGVSVQDSPGFTLTNNTASNNGGGFYLRHSESSSLTNNTANSNSMHGFNLDSSDSCVLTNNTASANSEDGFILGSSESCVLTDNTASDNSRFGFSLNSASSVLTNNTASNNSRDGFFLDSAWSCSLASNTANGNSMCGFRLFATDSCTLMNNTASSNGCGFYVWELGLCTLMYNTASNNGNGFHMYTSWSCNLRLNTATDNSQRGVCVNASTDIRIYNNTIFGNRIGIEISADSNSSQIYYNILYGNVQNAYDGGSNNVWDDGASLGNYWGDLDTSGQYIIPGTAGSIDRYARPYRTGTDLLLIILTVGILAAVAVIIVLGVRHRPT